MTVVPATTRAPATTRPPATRAGRGRPVRLWPIWLAVPTVLVLGLSVAGGAFGLLWLAFGRPPLVHAPWNLGAQLGVIVVSLIVTGGLGATVALVLGYRRQRIAESGERRENTRLFNERFFTLTAQLGHESAAVRLAGVYALATLADDWAHQRQTCVDVLCGYLRLPYQTIEGEPGWKEGEREVRLSVIRILRDHLVRDWTKDPLSWQGLNLDFTRAIFDGGDFSGSHFAGGIVSFEAAQFSGSISFMGTTFSGGRVSFVGAQFLGGNLYFADALFSGGNVYFMDALFSGGIVVFMGSHFRGANVSFMDTRFSGADVSFRGAQFAAGHVSFRGAQFAAGHVSFTGAGFSGGHVDLSHVNDWTAPVVFDPWLSDPPAGWCCPAGSPSS